MTTEGRTTRGLRFRPGTSNPAAAGAGGGGRAHGVRHDDDAVHADLARAYALPTRQLLPIAGMVAFYNEKVDTLLDGVPLERPRTHFS